MINANGFKSIAVVPIVSFILSHDEFSRVTQDFFCTTDLEHACTLQFAIAKHSAQKVAKKSVSDSKKHKAILR